MVLQQMALKEEVQYLVIYFLMEIMIQEIKDLFCEEYLVVVEENNLYVELEAKYLENLYP